MDVQEHAELDTPRERAWPQLCDVQVVANCLPGATLDGGQDDSGAYPGRLVVAFGPTRATFAGRANLDVDADAHEIRILARGQDARGRSRATADVIVRAVALDPGRTGLDITGTIDVAGPLERFAATGGVHVARELVRSFADNLVGRLEDLGGSDDLVAVPAEPSTAGPATTPPRAPARTDDRPLSGFRLLWRAVMRWLRRRA